MKEWSASLNPLQILAAAENLSQARPPSDKATKHTRPARSTNF